MSNSGHSPLRIGVFLLSDTEANLLRALLRLFNYDNSFRWVFSDEAPYDALVVDHVRAQSVPVESLPQARRILRLVSTSGVLTEGDTMERPIRSNRFESWLRQVADELGGDEASAAVDPRPKTSDEAPVRSKVTTDSDHRKSFKLRRWPPAAILRNDNQHVRIATLLSRKSLSLSQLVRLAGQDEDEVMVFLRVMQSAQLLDVADHDTAPKEVTLPPVEPSIMKRLISGLRRSLGA